MKKIYVFLCALVMVFGLAFSGVAQAAISTFTDRPTFTSQGTIAFNYGFEDFTGGDFYYPGNPWTSHGVTYTSGANIIVGPAGGYGNATNVMCYDYWTPLTGTIGGLYNMFGFDLSVLGTTSALNLQVTTNLNTYSFDGLNVPNADPMDFYGFVAGSGEYFSSFRLDSQYGSGSAPAIDNVTLGAVPLPSAILLLGPGLIGLAAIRRRFKK